MQRIVDNARDASQLEAVLCELHYRSKPAARKLGERVRARLASFSRGTPSGSVRFAEQPGLFDSNGGSERPHGPNLGLRDHLTTPMAWASGQGKPKFPPTTQQVAAVDAFMHGGSLKISAFAGAGKTSTLKLMASRHRGRGIYLAFNSNIAREARGDFPNGVDCRTTHSLAARAVRARHGYARDKMFETIGPLQLAAVLELKPVQLEDRVTLTDVQQAHFFLTTVRRFCQSDDEEIQEHHTPMTGRLLGLKANTQADVHRWVQHQAKALWMRMCDAHDRIPLGHDGYLKLWSLGRPRLDYDYVLLDEAQDTNSVVLHVLKSQDQDVQLVYVGDRHQQIYEWRGAVNAMDKIPTEKKGIPHSILPLWTRAEKATLILSKLGETYPLTGNDRIPSRIAELSEVDAVLARTNATVIAKALAVNESGRKPFIVGGTQELKRLVSDVFNLMDDRPGSHPDFFGFSNWNDVVAFANTDEGEELRPFVTLVEQNGPNRLWAAIRSSGPDPAGADVCISTHKAKGGEWRSVHIADDFSGSTSDGGPIPESEARLFYVAITRAKEVLSISPTLLSRFTEASCFVSDKEAAEARRRSRAERLPAPPLQPTHVRPSGPAVAGHVLPGVSAPKQATPPPPSPRLDGPRYVPTRDMTPAQMPEPERKRGFLDTLLGLGSREEKA